MVTNKLTGPLPLSNGMVAGLQDSSVYQIADCMVPMCCDGLCCGLLDGGKGNAIFHMLQPCIGRPEITAVDLLRNKIVTDITLYHSIEYVSWVV